MKNLIKKLPLPIVAVGLGFAGLGNLIQSHSLNLKIICGIISGLIIIFSLIKIIIFPKDFKSDMQNPVMASVFAALPMTLMLLSTYIKPVIGGASYYLWIFSIILHALLIIYFTMKFIISFDFKKVFASYYIMYVGIVVGSVTAPVFDSKKLGSILVWFGLLMFLIFFVLVTIRHIKYKQIPDPLRSLVCIYSAPLSLCTAGYVQSVDNKNPKFLAIMLFLSTIIYLIMFAKAITFILKYKFFPSFAAFTFPFVISAIASKMSMAYFASIEKPISFLPIIVNIQTIIAVLLCLFTLIKYMAFLFNNN